MKIRSTDLEPQERKGLRGARASIGPLVVKPREAWQMLGCGNTRGYELLAAGELEPISKSSEEDDKAGELDEAEEVVGVVLPTDEDAALPLDPSKETLDQPASRVAA